MRRHEMFPEVATCTTMRRLGSLVAWARDGGDPASADLIAVLQAAGPHDVRRTLALAEAAGFVRTEAGRVVVTADGRRIGADPNEDWARAFSGLVCAGAVSCWYDADRPAWADLLDDSLFLFLAVLDEGGVAFDNLAEAAWTNVADAHGAWTDEVTRRRTQRAVRRDVARMVQVLAELGMVRDGRTVALTALGSAVAAQVLDAVIAGFSEELLMAWVRGAMPWETASAVCALPDDVRVVAVANLASVDDPAADAALELLVEVLGGTVAGEEARRALFVRQALETG